MTIEFSQLDLDPKLVQTVAELGYTTPTDIQAQVIPLMLDGKDVIAQSQTGSGKTAAFALPILQDLIYGGSQRSNQKQVPHRGERQFMAGRTMVLPSAGSRTAWM